MTDTEIKTTICSHCHKWLDKQQFYRANWKNTAERYFKICNACDRNKKLPKLLEEVDKLDQEFKTKYRNMSPED